MADFQIAGTGEGCGLDIHEKAWLKTIVPYPCYPFGRKDSRRGYRQFFSMRDDAKEDAYPPTHKAYWNATDAYLMGNVTPGDMRAIIQSQETGSLGGGLACIDLLNRMWDCRTKRRISAKTVLEDVVLEGKMRCWKGSGRSCHRRCHPRSRQETGSCG